jgi:amino-acid N-acetyltransferase
MEHIRFTPATAADLPAVRTLLESCELPVDDLQPAHLEHFVACRLGHRLVGTVGIEIMGDTGLLRSLAVVPELRGRRLGHDLWKRLKDEARRRGIHRLYLLTTTAEKLFERWGFQRVERDAVPDAIRGTAEFTSLCPSTAALMALDLPGETSQRVL